MAGQHPEIEDEHSDNPAGIGGEIAQPMPQGPYRLAPRCPYCQRMSTQPFILGAEDGDVGAVQGLSEDPEGPAGVYHTWASMPSPLLSPMHTSNTTRAGMSRGDKFYAACPVGTELLTDTTKLYKAALGNCFEEDKWGSIEFKIAEKHFDRQGKPPYAYHAQYMAHLLSYRRLDGSG